MGAAACGSFSCMEDDGDELERMSREMLSLEVCLSVQGLP